MERLGDKMLAKIFRLVPKEDELKLFRVCKRWYRVMDIFVGIRVTIGRLTERLNGDETADSINILGKVGIRSCKVYCLMNEIASLPKLKQPELLQFVSFKNFVSSSSFTSILTGVTNLHTFQIDQDAIFSLDFSEIEFSLPCQVLDLSKGSYLEYYTPYELFGEKFGTLNLNTMHLLRNVFPGLKKLNVNLTVLTHNYHCITNELVNFLCKHSEGLIEVEISLKEKGYYFWRLDSRYTVRAPALLDAQTIQATLFPNLCNIRIRDGFSYKKNRFCWIVGAIKMPSLETAKPSVNIYSIDLQSQIAGKNEAVITKICIGVLTPSGWPPNQNTFDCAAFKDCLQLMELKIRADGCGCGCPCGCGRGRSTQCEKPIFEVLLNADQLPKSIETLFISGLAIPCETCELLCLQLPALKWLELTENSATIGYQVPRDVAEKLIQQKKLKKFVIEVGTRLVQDPIQQTLDQAYHEKEPNRRIIGNLEHSGEYKLEVTESQKASLPSYLI